MHANIQRLLTVPQPRTCPTVCTQASGVEGLVRLLLHDAAFAKAVQQKDGETAAAAAVGVVKVCVPTCQDPTYTHRTAAVRRMPACKGHHRSEGCVLLFLVA